MNLPGLLLSFGFNQESNIVSLMLFIYLFSISVDIPLRMGLNAYARYQEWQADMYATEQGYGESLQKALIRSHAISLEPLFVSSIE